MKFNVGDKPIGQNFKDQRNLHRNGMECTILGQFGNDGYTVRWADKTVTQPSEYFLGILSK